MRFPKSMVLMAMLAFAGCSEMKVAPVAGTVTLDGAPLPRASVTFLPKAGGRPSYGVTDADGKYVLDYNLDSAGAEIGMCTVRVTTGGAQGDDESKRSQEKVPPRYFKEPLEFEVKAQSNTIDIALTSK